MMWLLGGLVGAGLAAEGPRWTVQVDPLTAALGYAHVQVERALSPGVSVYAGPHLRLYDALFAPEHEPYIGLGGEVGARWFPRGAAPAGPWVMGRGVLARLQATDGSGGAALGGYGSALVGYTWIGGGRWVLSGGAGAQYIHYTVEGMGVQGIFPALHTALGVAF